MFAMFLMPLNLCPSMYSYSRLPTEGLPSEVESMLRCMRIYSHGTWLAEETERFVIFSISLISMCILSIYIQLGMGCRVIMTSFIFSISAQQGKSGRLQFTAPTIQKPISSGNELILASFPHILSHIYSICGIFDQIFSYSVYEAGDSQVPFVEKKSVRQNIAIQVCTPCNGSYHNIIELYISYLVI